jgi:adenylate cyclase
MTVSPLDPPPTDVPTSRATVLFADLRGYTRIAEQLNPGLVAALLEEFFGVLVPAALEQGGEVFHVAGDGMMAGFGLRDAQATGACQALAAARAMLDRFAPLARRWTQDLAIQGGLGIGVHLGDIAWGRLGPPHQQFPTLVGDTVNVAARLCARARAGEVLFSSAVARELEREELAARGEAAARYASRYLHLPQLELRGRTAPLDIWCVPAAERAQL